jgi:hypothetical protein
MADNTRPERIRSVSSAFGGAGREERANGDVPDIPGLDLPPSKHRVFCGDLDIRIDRDGRWLYRGSPIERKELVCLFASVLQRDDNGDYWMVTPGELARIEVEDAPFVAVELFVSGAGQCQTLSFRTNVDEVVTVGPDNPLRVETDSETGEPAPYVRVRDGMDAKIARSVFYDLVERGREETINGETVFGVWSQNQFFPMGSLSDS